jgi:hypothetical protein
MSMPLTSLGAAHSALSHLCFAVGETLAPMWVQVRAQWQNGTYLTVEVMCREKNKQEVIDRLLHGALVQDYDYRFRVSYPTGPVDPHTWVTVTAYPDMQHDDRRFKERTR